MTFSTRRLFSLYFLLLSLHVAAEVPTDDTVMVRCSKPTLQRVPSVRLES